jgi:hypothetical protein
MTDVEARKREAAVAIEQASYGGYRQYCERIGIIPLSLQEWREHSTPITRHSKGCC